MISEPDWLVLGRELLAIAQTGLAYVKDPYDAERYERIRELAGTMLAPACAMDAPAMIEFLRRETGYTTPKTETRGAVFRDGRILLVRETGDGRWSLPGGWADVNQSPAECIEREILEESGYVAKCTKLASVWDSRTHNSHGEAQFFHIYKFFFLCELTGGEARHSVETDGVDFFAEEELPELSLNRVNEKQVRRMFDHYRAPELPTDFE